VRCERRSTVWVTPSGYGGAPFCPHDDNRRRVNLRRKMRPDVLADIDTNLSMPRAETCSSMRLAHVVRPATSSCGRDQHAARDHGLRPSRAGVVATPTRSASSWLPSHWWPAITWPHGLRRRSRHDLAGRASCTPATRCWWTNQGRLRVRAHSPRPRSRSVSRGSRRQLPSNRAIADRADPRRPSSLPFLHNELNTGYSLRPPKGVCCCRPARMRQDADRRQGGCQPLWHKMPRSAATTRARRKSYFPSTSRARSG